MRPRGFAYLAAFFLFATVLVSAAGFLPAAGAGAAARAGLARRARGASPVVATAAPAAPPLALLAALGALAALRLPPPVPARASISSTAWASVTCSGVTSFGSVAL